MRVIVATPSGAGRNSRESIISTALSLLDEYGLPDLTMRRIAGALGVQPSALYWHFVNKQLLLAEVSDRITHAVPSARSGSSRQSLEEVAVELRDVLLAHRDGAELVSSSHASGLTKMRPRNAIQEACLAGGLSTELARTAADTTVLYVLGYVFHEQQHAHAESVGAMEDSTGIAAMDAFPTPSVEFANGLKLISAGVRVLASNLADK